MSESGNIRKSGLYTDKDIEDTYNNIQDMLLTKYIIKSYSTNNCDIRDLAVGGIDLSSVENVLELGSGYGFFIEKLKGKLSRDADICGIDLVEQNRDLYLNTVASIGYRGRFINSNADIIKTIEPCSFDLVISCYSIYFFPHLIPDILNVMKKGGRLIIVTHSKYSLNEAIAIIPLCNADFCTGDDEPMISRLFSTFSLENGRELLKPFFDNIDILEYKNKMIFQPDAVDDCIYYLIKKKNLIYKDIRHYGIDRDISIEEAIAENVKKYMDQNRTLSLTKDDAVFRCLKC